MELFQKETDLETRRTILKAIATGKTAAPGVDLVLGILEHPKENAGILLEAVATAERMGGSKMIVQLANLVRSDSAPDVVARALAALGTLKAIDAIPTIASRLSSEETRIRTAANDALTAIGGPAVIKALVPLLADKKVETRRLAVAALGSLKIPAVVDPLLQAFADPEIQTEAVAALSGIVDGRAVPAYLVRSRFEERHGSGRLQEGDPRPADGELPGHRSRPYRRLTRTGSRRRVAVIYTTKLPVVLVVPRPVPGRLAACRSTWPKCHERGIQEHRRQAGRVEDAKRRGPCESSYIDLRKEQKPTEPAVAYAIAEAVLSGSGRGRVTGRVDGGDLTLWMNGR